MSAEEVALMRNLPGMAYRCRGSRDRRSPDDPSVDCLVAAVRCYFAYPSSLGTNSVMSGQ